MSDKKNITPKGVERQVGELLTVAEIAERIHQSPKTIYNKLKKLAIEPTVPADNRSGIAAQYDFALLISLDNERVIEHHTKSLTMQEQMQATTVYDVNYDTVKAYHIDVWHAVYGLEL